MVGTRQQGDTQFEKFESLHLTNLAYILSFITGKNILHFNICLLNKKRLKVKLKITITIIKDKVIKMI